MSNATRKLEVIIAGDASKLQSAVAKAEKSTSSLGTTFSKIGKMAKVGLEGATGVAVAFAVSSVKSADDFESSQAQLKRAITDTGGQWDSYQKQIKGAQDQGVDWGFHIGDTENALTSMTTGLGNAQQALKLLPLAENIAKGTGKDLSDTALLVTKSYEGNTKALKQLGIDLPVASTSAAKLVTAQKAVATASDAVKLVEQKIHDGRLKGPAAADALRAATDKLKTRQDALTTAQTAGQTITDALTKRYNGSAAAAADTFAGKQAKISAQFDRIKIHAGQAIEGGLVKLANWYDKSGSPMMSRFASGLDRVGQDGDHVVNAMRDIIKFGDDVAHVISKIFGGGSSTGGSISHPDQSVHPTPGPAPGGKAPFYGPLPVHRASGGPVSAGMPYLVGEYGPEPFVPNVSGTIIPAGKFGGGVVVNLNVNVSAGLGASPKMLRDLADAFVVDHRTGGPMTLAIKKLMS